jgi:hypothetical protein
VRAFALLLYAMGIFLADKAISRQAFLSFFRAQYSGLSACIFSDFDLI